MNGILIVAHGSREQNTHQTMLAIVDMVKAQIGDKAVVELGYMEFCSPSITAGLEKLVKCGVTYIKVVPYFLFEGVHIKEDIPNVIAEFAKENEDVSLVIMPTLGVDKRLADILIERCT